MNRALSRILSFTLPALLAAAGGAHAQAGCPGGTGVPLTIANVKAGETLGYDLLLVKGAAAQGTLSVTLSAGAESSVWPAAAGLFKGFIRLKPGNNQVVVSAAGQQNACVDVTYAPNPFAGQVRLAYVVPKGLAEGTPRFRAPADEPSDLASLKKRLAFAALLQQSLLGELLAKAGKPRLAPHIVRDASGEPDILVLQSDKTAAELESGQSAGAYDYAQKALKPHLDGRTRFQAFYAKVPGVFRLSAGTLSGLDDIYTWPQDASELVSRFTDRRSPKDLGVPGATGDTVSLCARLKSGYSFWFKLGGLWTLDIPGAVDTVAKDPFGKAYGGLHTLFMVKTETGADVKEDFTLGPISSAGLSQSPWLADPNPARLPALPASAVPPGLVPGITYKYYEGSFDKLPDFASLAPAASGVLSNFSLDARRRDQDIAFVFDAWLMVPRSGPWLFQLASDDGSRLLVDGRALIENDSTHVDTRIARGTALDSGLHRIQIQYFNKTPDRSLGVQWASAAVPLQAIPTSALRREPVQTAIRSLAAPADPLLTRGDGEVRLLMDRSGPVDLILVAPSGRFAGRLFRGVLPAGDHRFALPAAAAGGALFPVLRREIWP